MKNAVEFLTGNLILNLSIVAWALAQIIKFVVTLVTKRKLDFRHMFLAVGAQLSFIFCQRLCLVHGIYVWMDLAPLYAGCGSGNCSHV